MPDLPEHLEQLVEAVERNDEDAQLYGFDNQEQVNKLRRILEAAWAVGSANPITHTDRASSRACPFCGWYEDCVDGWPEDVEEHEGMTDCPHHKLKEALSDDPNS